jgi:hypothetical protein
VGGYKWLAYKILTSDDYVVGGTFNSRLRDWSNLQIRVIEAYPLKFSSGGPTTFLYGDMITIMRGATKIGTARVNGTPVLTSGSWAGGNAAGILTLSNAQLEDGMSIQLNDDLLVYGQARARAEAVPPDPWTKTNFIRVYYGDTSAHGTPSDCPTDNGLLANPQVTESGRAAHWPVDDVSDWAAGNDYLTLVQWDAVNDDDDLDPKPVHLGGSGTKEENAIIRTNTLLTPDSGDFDRPEIALHTFGNTSNKVYFDDFAIQVEAISGSRTGSLPPIQQ